MFQNVASSNIAIVTVHDISQAVTASMRRWQRTSQRNVLLQLDALAACSFAVVACSFAVVMPLLIFHLLQFRSQGLPSETHLVLFQLGPAAALGAFKLGYVMEVAAMAQVLYPVAYSESGIEIVLSDDKSAIYSMFPTYTARSQEHYLRNIGIVTA